MPKYDLSDFDKQFNDPADLFSFESIKSYIQTKIDQEVKKIVEEIKEEVLSAKYGTKNRVELLCKLNSYLK